MQLVLYLLSIHFVILDDGHRCGMLMKLLLVELCHNCIIDLIYFAHMVLVLAVILNLLSILLLLMNGGGVRLLPFLEI